MTALKNWADTETMRMPTNEDVARALTEILEPVIRDLVVEQVSELLPETGVEREGMTAEEVAIFLGLERKTIYDYANRGVIPHRRVGKRLVFSRQALMTWLDARTTQS